MGCKGSSVRITPSRPNILRKSSHLAVTGFFVFATEIWIWFFCPTFCPTLCFGGGRFRSVAARAAFFPGVSLTVSASAGSASSLLSQLFTASTGAWSFTPSLSLPIFDAGKNRAQLDVAKVAGRIEVANHEQAVQTAFKKVNDALIGNASYAQEVDDRLAGVSTNAKYLKLASMRYEAGREEYLQVLTAQRSLYLAQQQYIDALTGSMAQQFVLYKVLGGGWT